MIVLIISILFILMFGLGLELTTESLVTTLKRPRPLVAGLIAQQVFIPAIAFLCVYFFKIEPVLAVGVMLVACSAGGASSNILSGIVGGNIGLSIWLTTFSTVISIISLPAIIAISSKYFYVEEIVLALPIGKTIIQLFVITILPLILGRVLTHFNKRLASKCLAVIRKSSLPLFSCIVILFFIEQFSVIADNIFSLGIIISLIITLSMGFAHFGSRLIKLTKKDTKTLTIEVGIQNAAQAISIAVSPFLLNDSKFAVPAIIYSLLMNVFVLLYMFRNKIRTQKPN